MRAGLQFKKLQHIRVADKVARIGRCFSRNIGSRLLLHCGFIQAQQAPLIKKRANLTIQRPHTPGFACCLIGIPRPGFRALEAQQHTEMRPRQFSPRRGENWKAQVKLPVAPQTLGRKTLAEFSRQALGQRWQYSFAVRRPFFPALLALDDQPADFPISLNHGRIDRLPRTQPGSEQHLADATVQIAPHRGGFLWGAVNRQIG